MKNPSVKSAIATACFALAGLFALLFRAPLAPELLPHSFFFATLLLNTFFSIRFFASFQPEDARQLGLDSLLALSYIALALSLGRPLPFAVFVLLLFGLATLKYVVMRGKTPHERVIRRKIIIDALGVLLCSALLALTLASYSFAAAWGFALIFAAANVHLLWSRPMYRY